MATILLLNCTESRIKLQARFAVIDRMLNAQNKERPISPIGLGSDAGAASNIGTVLESVQGLQQRLGDFSVDEISEAEATVRTLISRVYNLVKKLDRVTEVQRWVADARRMATEAENESIELPDLNVLDHSLPVHTIVQGNNLIPFPRPKKVLKENSENSLQAPASELQQSGGWRSKANGLADQQVESSPIGPENRNCELEGVPATDVGGEQVPLTLSAANEAPTPAVAAPEDSALPQEDFPAHNGDEDLARSEIARIFAEDFGQSPEGEAAELLATAPTFEFAKKDEQATEPKKEDSPGVDFDQRLLDDLIKNYGEFTASPTASAQAEAPTAPSRPAPVPADHRELRTSETSQPQVKGVPSARKEGQLDRELKKIIKDYGEVDLYSHRSPINLKIAGIAAFLLLGALVAGFYFYYSPSKAAVDIAPAESSTVDQSLLKTGTAKRESTGTGEKGLAGRNVTPAKPDGTIEGGNSQ